MFHHASALIVSTQVKIKDKLANNMCFSKQIRKTLESIMKTIQEDTTKLERILECLDEKLNCIFFCPM